MLTDLGSAQLWAGRFDAARNACPRLSRNRAEPRRRCPGMRLSAGWR